MIWRKTILRLYVALATCSAALVSTACKTTGDSSGLKFGAAVAGGSGPETFHYGETTFEIDGGRCRQYANILVVSSTRRYAVSQFETLCTISGQVDVCKVIVDPYPRDVFLPKNVIDMRFSYPGRFTQTRLFKGFYNRKADLLISRYDRNGRARDRNNLGDIDPAGVLQASRVIATEVCPLTAGAGGQQGAIDGFRLLDNVFVANSPCYEYDGVRWGASGYMQQQCNKYSDGDEARADACLKTVDVLCRYRRS